MAKIKEETIKKRRLKEYEEIFQDIPDNKSRMVNRMVLMAVDMEAHIAKLEEELRTALSGIEKLVFDLKDLAYISSAGLRVLLSAEQCMEEKGAGQVKVINLNDTIRNIFDITGFSDILTIE